MNIENKNTVKFSTILFLACIGHFVIDFMLGIWPIFKTMIHMDLALAGMIAATCVIIGEAMQLVFGSMADKGHQKRLLMMGILLGCFSTLLSYFTGNLAFLILYFLTCMGSAAFHPTAASLLGHLDTKYKGIIMGLFSGSGMLGLGLSQLSFSWTYKALDGHTAVLVIPAIILMVVIFCANCSVKNEGFSKEHIKISTFVKYFNDKTLRALYFSLVANQITLWSCVFLLPDFLASRNHSEWTVFGGGHFLLMLGATISPPVLGFFADRTNTRQVIMISMWSAVTIMSLLLFIPACFAYTPVLLFMLGSVLGGVASLVWAMGNHLFPQSRGSVSAFLMGGVWIVSESLGIGLSGILADMFVHDGPAMALACMSSSLFLGVLAAPFLPKSQERLSEKSLIV